MDLTGGFGVRSTGGGGGLCREELGFESLTTLPPENASFTALLELPATQALELLHFSDSSSSQAVISEIGGDTFMERAARYSVIGNDQQNGNISGDTPTSSVNANLDRVKAEPVDNFENQIPNFQRKRKDFEKKVRNSTKKKTKCSEEETEKLPYVHVRARRGQATDSHSLAERARREKINVRMKLLQELVPGCDKIQGTALVLDEIINHVQSLQRQVEMLSMRLAAVNPRIDFNLSTILSSENGSLMDGSFNSNAMHLAWPNQVIETEQSFHQLQLQQPPQPQQWLNQPVWEREEDQTHSNLMARFDNLNPNQVKMELP